MTREEAITLIKAALKTMYLPKSKEYISDLGYALEIAIEALEQEPILDKIRAEIEQTADEEQKHDEKWARGLRYAVKIIDKYRDKEQEA